MAEAMCENYLLKIYVVNAFLKLSNIDFKVGN